MCFKNTGSAFTTMMVVSKKIRLYSVMKKGRTEITWHKGSDRLLHNCLAGAIIDGVERLDFLAAQSFCSQCQLRHDCAEKEIFDSTNGCHAMIPDEHKGKAILCWPCFTFLVR